MSDFIDAPEPTPLTRLLDTFRAAAVTEREKGTYFEDLIRTYLRNEASYRDLYSEVWTYGEWAKSHGLDARDTGIDLVARTQGTNELHAIQCKNYAPDYRIQKKDIDSFFTASGKQAFKHRIIVATTNHWSEHAEEALRIGLVDRVVHRGGARAAAEALAGEIARFPQVCMLGDRASVYDGLGLSLGAT